MGNIKVVFFLHADADADNDNNPHAAVIAINTFFFFEKMTS